MAGSATCKQYQYEIVPYFKVSLFSHSNGDSSVYFYFGLSRFSTQYGLNLTRRAQDKMFWDLLESRVCLMANQTRYKALNVQENVIRFSVGSHGHTLCSLVKAQAAAFHRLPAQRRPVVPLEWN